MTSSHTSSKIAKVVAAAAAIVALAFGANAIANGNSSSATANGTQTAAGRPGNGGTPGGMGTAVTGATLTKLKAAATAKYPGTVERAMKLADGSYVVPRDPVRQQGRGARARQQGVQDHRHPEGRPARRRRATVRLGPAERDEILLIPVVVPEAPRERGLRPV